MQSEIDALDLWIDETEIQLPKISDNDFTISLEKLTECLMK